MASSVGCGVLAALLILAPVRLPAEAPGRGFGLAVACFGCHGTDGVSRGAIPSLAGRSERFLRLALDEYKSGASSGTVMNRIARGYSDEELALLAAWFAGRRE